VGSRPLPPRRPIIPATARCPDADAGGWASSGTWGGGALYLAELTAFVHRAFGITRAIKVFHVFPRVEHALRAAAEFQRQQQCPSAPPV
jgi:hypothetical protein